VKSVVWEREGVRGSGTVGIRSIKSLIRNVNGDM